MHRCLQVPEILLAITDAVASNPSHDALSRVEMNTHASLARTCKAFHDMAMDALWAKQYGLNRLIKLLPSHTWELRRRGIAVSLVFLPLSDGLSFLMI